MHLFLKSYKNCNSKNSSSFKLKFLIWQSNSYILRNFAYFEGCCIQI